MYIKLLDQDNISPSGGDGSSIEVFGNDGKRLNMKFDEEETEDLELAA